jgi:fatty-acid desaturase
MRVTKPPWERSWLYRAPGETPTLLWIVGIHVASIVGLILLPMPSWWVVGIGLGLVWMGGLGTTVAYHRALAHKAVVLSPIVERTLVFFAMFNGSGNPLTWVANHRFHHAHADKDADVSSPRHGGFWWAHLRWLWQAEQALPARYCPDLVKRNYTRWGRAQVPVLALSVFGGLLVWPFVGWIGALATCLVLGPLRLVFALHVQCSVNSLCHLGPLAVAHGSALNVAWMMPFHLGQGENWHANHHVCANDARLGQRWWQIDAGWWTIALMEKCGLAREVRGRQSLSHSNS